MRLEKYCSLAVVALGALLLSVVSARAQDYDMILQGGHVLDAKNHVDAVEDVAVKDGSIAEVAPHIDPKKSCQDDRRQGILCYAGSH